MNQGKVCDDIDNNLLEWSIMGEVYGVFIPGPKPYTDELQEVIEDIEFDFHG